MQTRRLAIYAALALFTPTLACDELPDRVPPAEVDSANEASEDGGDEDSWGSTGDDGCEDTCADDEGEASENEGDVRAAPQLQVLLTDAPLDVDSVYVTISEVRVQSCDAVEEDSEDEPGDAGAEDDEEPITGGAGGPPDGIPVDDAPEEEEEDEEEEDDEDEDEDEDAGSCEHRSWQTVVDEEATFDLLTLQNGVTEQLGLVELPPGHYGQIRLMLVDASVVVDGESFPLTVPSGAQSGIKLNHGFDLAEGLLTSITLDFDAGKSVHYAPGNGWMMRPVIEVIATTTEPLAEEPDKDEPDPDEPDPYDQQPDAPEPG